MVGVGSRIFYLRLRNPGSKCTKRYDQAYPADQTYPTCEDEWLYNRNAQNKIGSIILPRVK